jgi:hypothetical protein
MNEEDNSKETTAEEFLLDSFTIPVLQQERC